VDVVAILREVRVDDVTEIRRETYRALTVPTVLERRVVSRSVKELNEFSVGIVVVDIGPSECTEASPGVPLEGK
jgi:hypothetical protein